MGQCLLSSLGSASGMPLWFPAALPALCHVILFHARTRCQPGWFNLQPHNPIGCTSCFCYGHSAVCMAADGYEVTHIRSDFREGMEFLALGGVGLGQETRKVRRGWG